MTTMNSPLPMLGARNPTLPARTIDYYKTHPIATEALLSVERFEGSVWEPACGDGAISTVLKARGLHKVVSTDLCDHGYGYPGVDFLTQTATLAENVVTNPPFLLAEQFAIKACELATGKVALLCRLGWLESQSRKSMFEALPLTRVWVFAKRLPMMHRDGWTGKKTSSAIAFAWFVFDKKHEGPATIGWL